MEERNETMEMTNETTEAFKDEVVDTINDLAIESITPMPPATESAANENGGMSAGEILLYSAVGFGIGILVEKAYKKFKNRKKKKYATPQKSDDEVVDGEFKEVEPEEGTESEENKE